MVANPYSGVGPNRKRVDRLVRQLQRHGLAVRVVWELGERAALLADEELPRWCRCVVSAGGDGSLGDVINQMHRGGTLGSVDLATLPIGNENLFARHFGFECPVDRLVEAVAAGRSRRVDLGRVGDRLFTLMASAGFDAEVVHRMAAWRRSPGAGRPLRHGTSAGGNGGPTTATALRRVRRASYVGRIASTVREYAYPALRVETDDGRVATGAHVFVFNLPRYGMNLGIARHARGDDALLDYVVFQRPGLLSLADYALAVLRTRHLGRPDVPHGQARRLTITAADGVTAPIQADGDPAAFTPATLEVLPGAARVVVV